jgi:uncharacterized protein YjiK
MRTQKVITILSIAFLLLSCKSNKSGKIDKPQEFDKSKVTDSSALSWYDLSDEAATVVKLPDEIKEISGIAHTPDYRFFCHGDEDADIFEIDPKSGKILKSFHVGSAALGTSVRGDFEDIAFVKDRFYLLESKGHILEFKEGNDGEDVEYQVYKTKLKSSNNCEGLCYDPETNSLLITCKDSPGEDYKGNKAVYSFFLDSKALEDKPRFLIPFGQLHEKEFSPSGIAKHPKLGTFFIISSRAGKAIVEISKSGVILDEVKISKDINKQPEGITFDKQGNLIITNEGRSGTPRLVIYPLRK